VLSSKGRRHSPATTVQTVSTAVSSELERSGDDRHRALSQGVLASVGTTGSWCVVLHLDALPAVRYFGRWEGDRGSRKQVLSRLINARKPGGWLVVADFDCTWMPFAPACSLDEAALFVKVIDAFHESAADDDVPGEAVAGGAAAGG
jgi:hypothetical protein